MFQRTLLYSAFLLGTITPVSAVEQTFNFTGVVTAVDEPLDDEFAIGELVIGSITFESATADSQPSDAGAGLYENAITDFNATIGGDYSMTGGTSNHIFVGNNTPAGTFAKDTYSFDITRPVAASVADYELDTFSPALQDFTATAFSSDDLPLLPPDVSDFNSDLSWLVFSNSIGMQKFVGFDLDSLSLVPEPPSFALALTILCLPFRRQR